MSASTHRKTFQYPAGFQQLLKDLSREVIRSQPENIYVFASEFFEALLEKRRKEAEMANAAAASDYGGDIRKMSASQLEVFFTNLFREADVDGNGYLDFSEFRNIMRTAELNLAKKQIKQIMVEADENEDGKIDYNEFVPVAVQVVQAIYAKAEALQEHEARESQAQQVAEDILLHGMTREEVDNMLETLFHAADTDGSGKLNRKEFRECLRHTDLGLTRKEINAIMAEVDQDKDGFISYEEFKPLCFSILVERFKTSLLEIRQSNTGLDQILLDVFSAGDPEGTGFLSHAEIRDLIRGADLGLTRMQIYSVMSAADQDSDGLINYRVFVPVAARMISAMLRVQDSRHRQDAIQELADVQDTELLHGLDEQRFEEMLRAELSKYDDLGNGMIDRQDFRQVLESGVVPLSPREINTLMAAIDVDADGRINYFDFGTYAYGILLHLAREAYVEERINQLQESEQAAE